jgi:hypothetical protein
MSSSGSVCCGSLPFCPRIWSCAKSSPPHHRRPPDPAKPNAEIVGRVTPHGDQPNSGLGSAYESQNIHSKREHPMSLISLIVTLIVIGVVLWLVNSYIPMDGKIKKILNVVVVICVVVWLLSVFGVIGRAGDIRVPQIR